MPNLEYQLEYPDPRQTTFLLEFSIFHDIFSGKVSVTMLTRIGFGLGLGLGLGLGGLSIFHLWLFPLWHRWIYNLPAPMSMQA